jgi:hypothetical protein
MPISDKKNLLRKMAKDCIDKSKLYRKRYKRYKFRDDMIDIFTSSCVACSMSFTIVGITFPILLIPASVLSGFAFIITQVQRQYDLKRRYHMDSVTYTQLVELSREISIVLRKNHLTNEEYEDFLNDVSNKLSLIEDTAIII